jgi:RecA-family ATPase
MRAEIEAKLIHRKSDGSREYYDCPKCVTKDPTASLVVSWANETFICNHCDSCGYRGHIVQLARDLEVKVPMHNNNYQKPIKKKYKIGDIKPKDVKLKQKSEININDRIRQMEALFDRSAQLVVCIDSNYGNLIKSDLEALEYDSSNFTHFKVNAGGSKAEDIKDLKYTLVECDEIADMSLQRGYLESLGLPIASLTWSGNKSLHAIVRVEAPNMEEYKRRVSLIHEVCDGVGFKIDKTKDCCRFTRLAGSINNKTGKCQQLIALNLGSHDWNTWESEILPKFIVTENVANSSSVKMEKVQSGFSSGFATFDYNDSGMKGANLTLLTGRRNQGKTTFSRQLVIAAAMQGIKCFVWYGEGKASVEKGYFARLIAEPGEIDAYDNGYGRTVWTANKNAEERYDSHLGKFIDMYIKPIVLNLPVFKDLISRMTDKARQGCKLFVIDNMMKLTADQPNALKAQLTIIAKLKEFCDYYDVHVVLICHPKKGEGHQSISGAMEQENTADTILRFIRIFDQEDVNNNDEFPPHEFKNVTAVVRCEKVRHGGKDHTMYMEFDQVRQANIEISYLDSVRYLAKQYKEDGFYSRPSTYVGM